MAEVSKTDRTKGWSDLNTDVLGKIYNLLTIEEKLEMSLACKPFFIGLKSANGWKTVHISSSDFRGGPICDYARAYGNMFESVNIECDCPVPRKNLQWCRNVAVLLEIMSTRSTVNSFKFKWVFMFRLQDLNEEFFTAIHNALGKFLTAQRNLKRLELCRFMYNSMPGMQFLKEIFNNGLKSLDYLYLDEFISSRSICLEQSIDDLFQLPSSLKILEIGYALLFGIPKANVSQALHILSNCTENLFIRVFARADLINSGTFEMMKPNDWRRIKRKFEALEVQLLVGSIAKIQDPSIYIIKDMPISYLIYAFEDPPKKMAFAEFLNHLLSCGTHTHLELLSLRYPDVINDVDRIFITFFEHCCKLESLFLDIAYPEDDSGLVSLLTKLGDGPKKIKKISLRLQNKRTDLRQFKSIFKKLNVDFQSKIYRNE